MDKQKLARLTELLKLLAKDEEPSVAAVYEGTAIVITHLVKQTERLAARVAELEKELGRAV